MMVDWSDGQEEANSSVTWSDGASDGKAHDWSDAGSKADNDRLWKAYDGDLQAQIDVIMSLSADDMEKMDFWCDKAVNNPAIAMEKDDFNLCVACFYRGMAHWSRIADGNDEHAKEAYHWFVLASYCDAASIVGYAQRYLGDMYRAGYGTPSSLARARYWYKRAWGDLEKVAVVEETPRAACMLSLMSPQAERDDLYPQTIKWCGVCEREVNSGNPRISYPIIGDQEHRQWEPRKLYPLDFVERFSHIDRRQTLEILRNIGYVDPDGTDLESVTRIDGIAAAIAQSHAMYRAYDALGISHMDDCRSMIGEYDILVDFRWNADKRETLERTRREARRRLDFFVREHEFMRGNASGDGDEE